MDPSIIRSSGKLSSLIPLLNIPVVEEVLVFCISLRPCLLQDVKGTDIPRGGTNIRAAREVRVGVVRSCGWRDCGRGGVLPERRRLWAGAKEGCGRDEEGVWAERRRGGAAHAVLGGRSGCSRSTTVIHSSLQAIVQLSVLICNSGGSLCVL